MIQLYICFCLLSHAAGYAFHIADYQLIECHTKLPQPAFRFDRDQFRYNEENSIVKTVVTKNRWFTTYPRKQPFCIRDCTNQAEQPLRLGCELTLRNCLTILSCSYAKICDFIVAQEMPDSLTTMFKISANCSDFSYRRQQNGLFVDDNAIVMPPKP